MQEKEAVTEGRSMQNKQQKTDKNSSTTNESEDMRRNKVVEEESEALKAEKFNYKKKIRPERSKGKRNIRGSRIEQRNSTIRNNSSRYFPTIIRR